MNGPICQWACQLGLSTAATRPADPRARDMCGGLGFRIGL